jgi:hypothetical protein
MNWLDALDDRQQKEVEFSRVYTSMYHHGTDGHHRMMLIDRLAKLLDTTEADLRTAQGQCKIFEEMVLDAVARLGDVGTPLPVSIARLKTEAAAAWRALQVFYQMIADLKAALDAGDESIDLDPYLFQVGDILRGASEALGYSVVPATTTTPEEAGRQVENAMKIAQRFDELFGRKGEQS